MVQEVPHQEQEELLGEQVEQGVLGEQVELMGQEVPGVHLPNRSTQQKMINSVYHLYKSKN